MITTVDPQTKEMSTVDALWVQLGTEDRSPEV